LAQLPELYSFITCIPGAGKPWMPVVSWQASEKKKAGKQFPQKAIPKSGYFTGLSPVDINKISVFFNNLL
jgi:hypothetical protein